MTEAHFPAAGMSRDDAESMVFDLLDAARSLDQTETAFRRGAREYYEEMRDKVISALLIPNRSHCACDDHGPNQCPDQPPSAPVETLDFEAALRQALDDLTVEDGKCNWAEVANILPRMRGELRAYTPQRLSAETAQHGPFFHVTQEEKDTCEVCERQRLSAVPHAAAPVDQGRTAELQNEAGMYRSLYDNAVRKHIECDAEMQEKLQNPAAVHINMLNGSIAKPSWEAIKHLYPEHFLCSAETAIAALAKRFWSIHPSTLDDMGLTREEFYASEMVKLFGALTRNEPQAAPEPTRRQYYYRTDGCPAEHSHSPDCICWHDEGTGPFANDAHKIISTWRTSPLPRPMCGRDGGDK